VLAALQSWRRHALVSWHPWLQASAEPHDDKPEVMKAPMMVQTTPEDSGSLNLALLWIHLQVNVKRKCNSGYGVQNDKSLCGTVQMKEESGSKIRK